MQLVELLDNVLTEKRKKYIYAVMHDGARIATFESGRDDIKYCVITYWEKLGIRRTPYIHSKTPSIKSARRRLEISRKNFDDQRDIPRRTTKLGSKISVIGQLKLLRVE